MNKTKQIRHLLIILCCILLSVTFQNCATHSRNCKHSDDGTSDSTLMVYKPNVYVYPPKALDLSLKLHFPQGGKIVTSIPEYKSGWRVKVATSGLIDDTYSYLFYESQQPNVWQTDYGWLVEKSNLATFFRENMSCYGFNDSEITDFTTYWIPRLEQYQYYLIYPQTKKLINEVIQLKFSQHPDNILRLFYFIKGQENKQQEIRVPTIEKFKREGYFVTEWGVILE